MSDTPTPKEASKEVLDQLLPLSTGGLSGEFRASSGTLIGRIGVDEGTYCEDEAIAAEIVRRVNAHNDLRRVLKLILEDIPQKRDWLSPDLEREAKELIK